MAGKRGMWRSNYKIGVSQLDEQHKQLISMTEDLLKALNRSDDEAAAECRRTMDFLKSFVVVHFGAEEMYMERTGYPGLAAHHALHEDFKEKLRDHELRLIRCNWRVETVRELADMLTRWWLYHIMNEDKKIVAENPAAS